jgi:preprotein translocase subunit YajC
MSNSGPVNVSSSAVANKEDYMAMLMKHRWSIAIGVVLLILAYMWYKHRKQQKQAQQSQQA